MHPEPPPSEEPPAAPAGWNTWSAPAYAQQSAEDAAPPAPPAKSKKPLVTALVVIGVLAAAVVAGAALFGGNDDDDTNVGEAPAAGRTYSDPQGEYTMAIDPKWHATVEGTTEFWFTDPTKETGENINVLTEPFDGDANAYLDESLARLPKQVRDVDVHRADVVQGPSGNDIVVMEVVGSFGETDERLGGYNTAVVGDGTAALATYVAPIKTFEDRKEEILPYLLTLQRT